MRCLTYSECATWCQQHDYPVTETDYYGRPAPAVRKHFELFRLVYPTDSGKKVALARAVLQSLDGSNEFLLWIADWAVWPSSQHTPLFTRFREAFGERRPLIEAPGHLLNASEFDDALSVLTTALLFYWDCHVFPAERGPVFFCSHDEWNGFFLPPGYDPSPVSERLSNWLPDTDQEQTSH